MTASLDGVAVQSQRCDLPRTGASDVGPLALTLPAGFRELRLELRRGNALLAENVYDLRFHDGGPAPVFEQVRRRAVDLILR